MGHVKSFEEFLFETLNSNSLNEEKLPTFDETAIFSTDPKQKRAENYWPSKYTKEILGKDAKNIARMVGADRWFIDENKKPLSLFKDPQTKNQLMSPEECLAIFKKTEGFVNCHPLILEKIKALPTQVKILEEWLANTEKALQYAIFLSYYGSRYYKKEFGKNDLVTLLKENKSKAVLMNNKTYKETVEPIVAKPAEPKQEYPVFESKIDSAKAASLFAENEWILSAPFKKMIDEKIAEIKENVDKIANNAKGTPKAHLQEMKITSSCSVAPNGKPVSSPGANKYAKEASISFKKLSEERANAVEKYAKEELAKIGVVVDGDSKIEKDILGTNQDGTSGDQKWSEVPGKTAAEKVAKIRKYQRADVDFTYAINYTVKGPEETPEKIDPTFKPIPVEVNQYTLTITSKRVDWWGLVPTITLPSFNLNIFGSRSKNPNAAKYLSKVKCFNKKF